MKHPAQDYLNQQGYLVLDGSMASQLERYGTDLNDPLWSARCLLDTPELIHRVHMDCLEAGADIISTASYQASEQGFMNRGLDASSGADCALLAYPNSGETWVAEGKYRQGECGHDMNVDTWFQSAARILGGCCRTGPSDIKAIRIALQNQLKSGVAMPGG